MSRSVRQIFVLLLAMACCVCVLAQPNIQDEAYVWQKADVDRTLNRVAQNPTLAGNDDLLETAVVMARKLEYDAGFVDCSTLLAQRMRNNGNYTSELRVLLQLINWFPESVPQHKLAEAWYSIGQIYSHFGVYGKAAEAYQQCLNNDVANAAGLKYKATRNLALTEQRANNADKSRSHYADALAMAQKQGNQNEVFWIYQQLARMQHDAGNYHQELETYQTALAEAKRLNLADARIKCLNNIGYAYRFLKQPAEAEQFFSEVLNATPEGTITEAVVQQNLGILYQNQKQYDKATTAFLRALEIFSERKQIENAALIHDFLALAYYQQGDSYNATEHNNASILKARKAKALDVLQSSYKTKSLIHQQLFEFEQALTAYKMHLHLSDSLNNIEQLRAASLEREQEFVTRLERELKLVAAKERLQDAELARKQAENETLTERARLAEKEADVRELEARDALNRLQLSEKQRKLDEAEQEKRDQQFKIDLLGKENEISTLELERERLNRMQEQRKRQLTEQDNRILELEGERQRSRLQMLIGLFVLILLILLVALYAYLQVRRKNKHIASQNVVIAAERDKSDNLLLNILPAAVAAELKEKGQTTPRQYDSVSVVFTDFSGFTNISEQLSPAELVQTLDKVFLEFDLISERNGMNRIKTIGDAYMCACGLPEPDEDHARKAVQTALEMRDFITQFNAGLANGQPEWNIRIGVNSGPVVAGVVGIKKFAYDIWGDAVNVASRMESSGQVGKVNVSESTHKLTQSSFAFEYRGKVHAKNKGEIDMYFAERANA